MSSNQNNNKMSSAENGNQLIAPNEIKQEADIKEEPMAIDDLVEFPAIFNDGIGQPLNNPNRYNGEGDHVDLPLNEVKSEVKPECAEKKKKKKELKSNGRNHGAMNNRQEQHASEHAARSVKKVGILNVQVKAFMQHQCDQCEYTTKYKHNLKTHLLIHTGEKPFPCSHCPKEFTQQNHLQNHMKMHVEEFLFNCAVCLKGFNEKKEKLAHEKECSIRRYECHLCKHSFGSMKSNLIRHIRIHIGAKPFACNECSKQFTQKSDLKRHMKLHHGPCSFHCSRCRLGFVQQNEMVAHEQKCNCRLYECYVCGKFYGLNKGRLNNHHMRTHTGDKPFQCVMCQTHFTQKGSLTKHINRVHNKSH